MGAHGNARVGGLVAALLLMTALGAWLAHGVLADRDEERFRSEIERIDAAIEDRMATYVQVVRGGLGLFEASEKVSRTEWLRFVELLELDRNYPGFKSLSYAPLVRRADLPDFLARVRAEPLPPGVPPTNALRTYELVAPAGSRGGGDLHSPLLYTAPFVRNIGALGADMIREPGRRAVMLDALRSGQARITRRVNLRGTDPDTAGFIAFVGLRKDGRDLGWLTAAFTANEFLRGLLGRAPSPLDFELTDGQGALLASTAGVTRTGAPRALPDETDDTFRGTSALRMPGRIWQGRYVAGADFASTSTTVVPLAILLGGTLVTGLLALIALAAGSSRRQAATLAEQAIVLERARDEAQAADRAKATFLATMSHEIRTPMNAVVGMSSMLLRAPLSEEQHERARVIRSSGEHLLGLINEILDVSKLEAGRIELEAGPLEVRGLIVGTVDLIRADAEARRVSVEVDIAPGTPPWVHGDDGRLRQVLLNLLANAVRHSPEAGRVRVGVGATPVPDGWELDLTVADTGPGIDPADRDRIFEPFEQGTGRVGGTGLGLSIASRLVEAMGGRIEVQDTPGGGATLHFWACVGAAQAPIRPAVPDPVPAVDDAFAALRVLVAEDNPLNQLMVRDVFGQLGLCADVVGDGEEAVAAVVRQPYDVVFLDLHMPVLDGLAAARELVATIPAPRRPRIVAMTADVTAAAREEAAAAGMEDFVAKPVIAADLVAVLRRSATVTAA
ncbi:CHASE domain-containing protein [Paraconexibacter algicola]|uniref:histidine kinase n=1 Tax=Paraconexibacter algicola TaxID=2133960 RepID=A0A2T4UM99_9ACTN|nr:CHASE domain-containing protein [Paraconexibacter algicola]PTL60331.1 hypothetical protein C7Y72_12125 [Paraconexibacter algicola]